MTNYFQLLLDLLEIQDKEPYIEVSKIIETADGKIKNLQQLGKKKLAYNVKKFREGIYVYMEIEAKGEVVSSLENFFKVTDSVIRYLTVKVEPKKKVEAKPKKEVKVKPEEKTEAVANEPTELPTPAAE